MKQSKGKRRVRGSGQVTKLKTPSVRELTKKLDIMWSQAVKARDKKCLRCGKENNLHSHHVFSRTHKSTRFVLDNGVTLCGGCHLFWAHRDTGGFVAWWVSKYGQPLFDRLDSMSRMTVKGSEFYEVALMTLNNALLLGGKE